MMHFLTRILAMAVIFISVSACGAEEYDNIIIKNPDGTEQVFSVEYAVTEAEKAQGFMHRTEIPADHSMLFIYDRPQITWFWMRNTLVPLDMLFFDADKKLVYIEHNATPHDENPHGPDIPVCYVLEVNGGRAAALNIVEGARFFANLSQECLPYE